MQLSICESIMWHETDGNVSLFHVESGEFLTLNDAGSRIWTLVSDHGERHAVLSNLVEEFAIGDADLAIKVINDTKEFIDHALANGWIEERTV
jgi:hypothetical protein